METVFYWDWNLIILSDLSLPDQKTVGKLFFLINMLKTGNLFLSNIHS